MKIKSLIAFSSAFFLVTLIAPLAAAAAPETFSDVPSSHPNYTAIMDLKSRGIISGYPDGTFKPANAVNRVEALKIILLGSQIDVPEAEGTGGFKDTQADAWYAKYILKAQVLAIVQGYPDGTFKPEQTVNLAENLKILLNTWKINLSAITLSADPYADVPKDQWYAKYAGYAKEKNLIDADSANRVYPAQGMTRGKLAEMMYRLIYINENGLDKYGAEESTPPSTEQNTYYEVNINNYAFNKSTMTIPVGGTVRWTNNDTVAHTVTSDTGADLSSRELQPGDTYIHTFNSTGTYLYHCNIHQQMKGEIIVKPANEVPTI